MLLFLRPVQFDGEQDPFRSFDFDCVASDVIASAHLAAEFGVPI